MQLTVLYVLTYAVPVMMILIMMLLIFTVIHAKITVHKRFDRNADMADHDLYQINEDNESKVEDDIGNMEISTKVSSEFTEAYSFISPEYMENSFHKKLLDHRRDSSSTSSSRSRSNSQAAVDALSRLMFSKPTESEKNMEVLDAVDIMEGNDVYDMEDAENRRTSWPQQSLKKRSSIRLRSLQNIKE